ncbi:MAG TPA: AAA family ATPase [Thermoanaerobaculia bacterium]|nr:AAA family ATPase [Thermoanaerobaculia bacterium]
MDKGAHFYKSDFQVHTPRDARWAGGDAVGDGERRAYAEELILACRRTSLDAIAITDHHDLVFFPYVKRAAQEELDDAGQPVPPEQRIVVFPGLELTLTAPNCQALLILDANFPENLFTSILTALAITAAPSAASKHGNIQRIPQSVVSDLKDLYNKLNDYPEFEGRFTVLPNVSETGHGTLLRAGFANFYKTMPSVGGYTDGPVSKFGKGNLAIVRGENRDYGFKALAVFQTSDNRRRDHADLGRYVTWVKWSEPTAEALRQACLAKESRLSLHEPNLPSLWIESMAVSNSKFLGRVGVDFNQQYNAVIGGRGTGKSTILEYLRWCLCDQPAEIADLDLAPVQTRRKKLIDDTLQRFDGEVVAVFVLNAVRHIVKRSSRTQEILLKIGDADFMRATEQEVRNLFAVQAYSQKQLSSVGVRVDELRRFVELPIKQQLDQIRSDIRALEAKLRTAHRSLVRKREIEAEMAKHALEVNSLSKQLLALRKGLKGLSEADQLVIGQKADYDSEELIIEGFRNDMDRAKQSLATFVEEFSNRREKETPPDTVNKHLIASIQEKYSTKFWEIVAALYEVLVLFEPPSLAGLEDETARWAKLKVAFDKFYEEAKTRAKANQQQLDQIATVERRIAEIKRLQMTNGDALAALGDPETNYTELRRQWDTRHSEKLAIVDQQCQDFSSLSDGLIKADLAGGIDTEGIKQGLKIAFAGLNIKEQKIEELCQAIRASADPIPTWNGLLAELEELTLHNLASGDALPLTPAMDRCGFIPNEKIRLARGLDPSKWLALSLTELDFNPVFLYCTSKVTAEYIAFADASAGQQATALLTVLLNQPGAPLIIDQPEDDVDSKMSPEIVQQIWRAKSRRQLIFASHNANFVVNGDAELVICCDYVKAGDQTGGRIKALGAIDNVTIKEEITAVTEGGKEAFKLRKEKYGF